MGTIRPEDLNISGKKYIQKYKAEKIAEQLLADPELYKHYTNITNSIRHLHEAPDSKIADQKTQELNYSIDKAINDAATKLIEPLGIKDESEKKTLLFYLRMHYRDSENDGNRGGHKQQNNRNSADGWAAVDPDCGVMLAATQDHSNIRPPKDIPNTKISFNNSLKKSDGHAQS